MSLSAAQIEQFKIDGYLHLPQILNRNQLNELKELTNLAIKQGIEPYELEADITYPGAPATVDSPGGKTIRRLLLAYERSDLIKQIARSTIATTSIKQILQCQNLYLNPNHHNCIMTKQPEFSSDTLWHRDTRYWHFNNKYLVNAWWALGAEKKENGAMKILPGSHRWQVIAEALDSEQFLRLEHPFNQDRLATQRTIELEPGDLLLFSAHCFHAADRNQTKDSKYSLVFTYHGETTKAKAKTRSALLAKIDLSV